MTPYAGLDEEFLALTRRIRVIVLIDAAESAGLAPLPILRLHTLAYLSNVLAPVWNMPVLNGKVFKRRGGPFYPALQRDVDCLVGIGVVIISGLSHVQDDEKHWRLEGSYSLNRMFADRILHALKRFEDESMLMRFIQELALAMSALSDDELDSATKQDATYSDRLIDFGNVIDFGEWQTRNFTANAANRFAALLPSGSRATAGEKLHLYVRHLQERMHGRR